MWVVSSRHSEEYVRANSAIEAIGIYYAAVEAKREADPDSTEVRELRLVAETVHSIPTTSLGGHDGGKAS